MRLIIDRGNVLSSIYGLMYSYPCKAVLTGLNDLLFQGYVMYDFKAVDVIDLGSYFLCTLLLTNYVAR